MIIQIDMHSSIPIYKQLKTSIVSCILTGDLKAGDMLPSVRQLASDLSINLHTVRKVYSMLAEDGYVKMHRSRGAIVCQSPKLDKHDVDVFEALLLPIIIELRARGIEREYYDKLMDKIWSDSVNCDAEKEV